jgi:hypothetical protein
VGSCECGNEHWGSINREEFLEWLSVNFNLAFSLTPVVNCEPLNLKFSMRTDYKQITVGPCKKY